MQAPEATPQITPSIGRMVMMSILSIILVCSVYFTVFTPYPLGLAIILFGRKIGFSVIGLALAAFLLITVNYIEEYSVFILYLLSACVGVVVGEIILRRVNPIRGMVIALTSFVLFFGGIYLSQKTAIDHTIKQSLLEKIEVLKPVFENQIEELKSSSERSSSTSAAALETVFNEPGPFIDNIINKAPGYIVMGVILMLWLNTFLLLKSQRLVKNAEDNKYSEKDLLNFKMPDQFIFPVLIGLGMYMWGEGLGAWAPQFGLIIIQILGIFYFFQGFGLYTAYLDFYKIRGILRSILMVITIMIAYEMIAFIGLFDMFINFRKYLKKRDSRP